MLRDGMGRGMHVTVGRGRRVLGTCLVVLLAGGVLGADLSLPDGLSPGEQAAIRDGLGRLEQRLVHLRRTRPAELVADVELFHRSVLWALRYEPRLAPADIALVRRGLARGLERAEALAHGGSLWAQRRGRLVRGYRSAVDGSVQPYGLIVPSRWEAGKPLRLDVVLHGSTRPVGMSELRFLSPFDPGDTGPDPAPDQPYLELRPLGRVENGYRWAGETDVFEAIEDVCRKYAVDRDRIVLRGMSMGASGAWHLGLKHPGYFAALGPYCGYVDTHAFSYTPIPNFVRVDALPAHQEATLRLLDSQDYAANAGVVPAVAAMGTEDPFFQAHVLMGNAFRRDGLRLVNLLSIGTGHTQDPKTFSLQMQHLEQHARRGRTPDRRQLRFVTWSLKYPRCHWVELQGLEQHYQRAEFAAHLADDGTVVVDTVRNVTRFALFPPAVRGTETRVRIAGQTVVAPSPSDPDRVELRRVGTHWKPVEPGRIARRQKRPGVQGPIDDAFSRPFLCVRGTGRAWNPQIGAWAEVSLQRFLYEWSRYMRGDARVKNDTDVTRDDVRRYHLILFGDPGSNVWIRRALPHLPVMWNRETLQVAGETYPSADHGLVLIAPSPFVPGGDRYVVLNSGHTFHDAEFSTLNYLLFPRLGDWAVMRVGPPAGPRAPIETPVRAGLCDEEWRPTAVR